jgi:hypothetical protein
MGEGSGADKARYSRDECPARLFPRLAVGLELLFRTARCPLRRLLLRLSGSDSESALSVDCESCPRIYSQLPLYKPQAAPNTRKGSKTAPTSMNVTMTTQTSRSRRRMSLAAGESTEKGSKTASFAALPSSYRASCRSLDLPLNRFAGTSELCGYRLPLRQMHREHDGSQFNVAGSGSWRTGLTAPRDHHHPPL